VQWQEKVTIYECSFIKKGSLASAGLPFFVCEEPMYKPNIPPFCQPCIDSLQARCLHLHTSFRGGVHFVAGEFWDDLTEVCDDCGANLDRLPSTTESIPDNQEILFESIGDYYA
jgi:hypothetical protein